MRRNNKALYEQIMRNVSREVKNAILNEEYVNDLPVIRTKKDVQLLNKADFKNIDFHVKGITFYIDLSYIFPEADWDDPIVLARFEYNYSSKDSGKHYTEIFVEYPENTLEDKGYSMDELDDYLYDNQDTWLYDFLVR